MTTSGPYEAGELIGTEPRISAGRFFVALFSDEEPSEKGTGPLFPPGTPLGPQRELPV